MRFAKPLDTALIEKLMRSHEVVVTVEEGAVGGLGAHVLTFASDTGLTDAGLKVRTMRPVSYTHLTLPTTPYV